MKTELEKKIFEIIQNMEIEKPLTEDIILHSDYAEEEVFDSITFVLLIVLLEEEFGVESEGDDLLIENISSFGKIVKLISNILEKKNEDD